MKTLALSPNASKASLFSATSFLLPLLPPSLSSESLALTMRLTSALGSSVSSSTVAIVWLCFVLRVRGGASRVGGGGGAGALCKRAPCEVSDESKCANLSVY